jgi:nardilysin
MTSPISSKSDKKQYRLIKLENGLKALLIHHEMEPNPDHEDTHEEKMSASESEAEHTESEGEDEIEEHEREKLAAVALCIGAGSFQDHDYGIEGLAHFVEHMIFMGSAKYPKENELDQFLNANGGSSNAETECEYTLFFFDIVEEHLHGALDRFSNLFASPLMLRDAMEREMEAVESEFQNNINNDSSRVMQLIASKAEGVAGTFTWGNLKTLKENVDGDKLYQSAHDFRKKFYAANNMYLCIESAESLDDLQELVKKYFSPIQSGSLHLRGIGSSDPFTKDFYEKIFYVKPKSDKLKLYITFVLPPMERHYKTKPHDYIAYIIQHEGVGSLSAYLKKK